MFELDPRIVQSLLEVYHRRFLERPRDPCRERFFLKRYTFHVLRDRWTRDHETTRNETFVSRDRSTVNRCRFHESVRQNRPKVYTDTCLRMRGKERAICQATRIPWRAWCHRTSKIMGRYCSVYNLDLFYVNSQDVRNLLIINCGTVYL